MLDEGRATPEGYRELEFDGVSLDYEGVGANRVHDEAADISRREADFAAFVDGHTDLALELAVVDDAITAEQRRVAAGAEDSRAEGFWQAAKRGGAIAVMMVGGLGAFAAPNLYRRLRS